MASSKQRLGRGLSGILQGAAPAKAAAGPAPGHPAPEPQATVPPAAGYREVPVDAVDPSPYQPRREIDEAAVAELAESIRSEGLLQPIVVRPVKDRFQLIAGERRWRAFQHLRARNIPARILEVSDASSASLALIENLQREQLNPLEEALGYASLIRDFDLTQEMTAERVGKPRATVANSLRLLQLSREIQGYLTAGRLSVGHAKVLLGEEDEGRRLLLARRIVETGMSVREAENLIRSRRREATGPERAADARSQALVDLEKRLGKFLHAPVALRHGARKGKIVIEYSGDEDLDRILGILGV